MLARLTPLKMMYEKSPSKTEEGAVTYLAMSLVDIVLNMSPNISYSRLHGLRDRDDRPIRAWLQCQPLDFADA